MASAVYNVFSSLHLIRFAGPPLRWLFFVSGLLGTAMIATGLVLWVVKRLPQRIKAGHTPLGHRLVEVLNVGTIAGLPCAIAAYFLANRLLPAQMPGRLDWEINAFFLVWALCLLHPLLRTSRQAWLEQLALGAALFVSLPLLGLLTAHSGLFSSLGRADWLLAGMDLTLLATATGLAFAAWKLARHKPPVRVARPRPAPRQKEVAL
ncbi:PepSY-associated TM region [Halopseudomonas pachastrellae]|nr:PepSY-associated TM region [Halopseudomonas pachastrellae]